MEHICMSYKQYFDHFQIMYLVIFLNICWQLS